MPKIRNLIFFLVVISILFLNSCFYLGKLYSAIFYFVFLNIVFSLLIVMEIIYGMHNSDRINGLRRENEKMQLNLYDLSVNTILLKTLTDIIETFGGEVTMKEVLNKITSSLKEIFEKETVIVQFLGGSFNRSVIGKEVEISRDIIEKTVFKGHPILINNTYSFPQYKFFLDQGITSFLIASFPLTRKVKGVVGIFSFEGKKFTLKDLELLRAISASTSLLVENIELLEKTKVFSITDSLTQLYNRRHFEDAIRDIITNVKQKDTKVSLCICDVDYFKHYNDENGHPAGDLVLKKIAEILKKGVKGADFVARYGGEEFVIVFTATIKENARKICETLRKNIKEYKFPNEEKQPNGDLTISFGLATFPDDAKSSEQLVKKADDALYR
jgi:diguanylate cyclase (GGDEF)-like protein